jgi:hypothetical protein
MTLTPVTKAKLKEAMGSNQRRLLLSAGTHGYRNAAMVKLSNQMSRKARSVDTRTPQNVDCGFVCQHDVYSAAAMLCEVMREISDGAWAKGNRCCSLGYELELGKLRKWQTVSDFLLKSTSVPLGEASQQTQLMCKLVKGMLRSDTDQFSAVDAAKHDFFTLVFFPKSLEDQLTRDGCNIPGGVPPWADQVPQNRKALAKQVLKPLKMLRGKDGIIILSVAGYSSNELITWYGRKSKSNGKHLFSKHAYPVSTNHLYCEGVFGAGAMTAERLIEEMSAGVAINSSRLEGAVQKGGGNCYVDWKNYILGFDGMIRIPVRARGEVGANVELVYDNAFDAGHNGAFKQDTVDSESENDKVLTYF